MKQAKLSSSDKVCKFFCEIHGHRIDAVRLNDKDWIPEERALLCTNCGKTVEEIKKVPK